MDAIQVFMENGFLVSADFPDISPEEAKELVEFVKKKYGDNILIITTKEYEEFLKYKKSKKSTPTSLIIPIKKHSTSVSAKKSMQRNSSKKIPVNNNSRSLLDYFLSRSAALTQQTTVAIQKQEEAPKREEAREEKKVVVEVRYTAKHAARTKEEVGLKILKNFEYNRVRNLTVEDFASMFVHRYLYFSKEFKSRIPDIKPVSYFANTTKPVENTAVYGIIWKVLRFKTSYVVTLEDDESNMIKVVVPLDVCGYDALLLTEDVVVAFEGRWNGNTFYASKLHYPDIPISAARKNRNFKTDAYAVFSADIHVGSKKFLAERFKRFIEWLNMERGDKDKASKVKYLFFVGDLVDGVGIYNEQYNELDIHDIMEQYEQLSIYLAELNREDIKVVVLPGNHDAAPPADPQPPFIKEVRKILEECGRDIIILSNPATVQLEDDGGSYTVLLYHGYSIDRYLESIPPLREGGFENITKVLEAYLKWRHLSPTFGLSPVLPDPQDYLAIDIVPDVFVTAHTHYCQVGSYRGTILISTGCWQEKTAFQEKVGHNPTPGKTPMLDLKRRKVSVLCF